MLFKKKFKYTWLLLNTGLHLQCVCLCVMFSMLYGY